ncbi:hypothetical protein GMA3_52 [Gordonia phage GMA3]|uniref:Uncharacterized protein n=1 Tax=Gordonia phage GMA3 TaxID=1647284 RepID=A0A0K0NKW5_9CAUD|nr:hypothetical protein AU105_gp052 [Gordonia phage GMA3]AKL88229.1 hypothetical protein GMA3_52 [Gordonia phage GMA3]
MDRTSGVNLMNRNGGKVQQNTGRNASELAKFLAIASGLTGKRQELMADKKAKDKAKRRAKRKRTGR